MYDCATWYGTNCERATCALLFMTTCLITSMNWNISKSTSGKKFMNSDHQSELQTFSLPKHKQCYSIRNCVRLVITMDPRINLILYGRLINEPHLRIYSVFCMYYTTLVYKYVNTYIHIQIRTYIFTYVMSKFLRFTFNFDLLLLNSNNFIISW